MCLFIEDLRYNYNFVIFERLGRGEVSLVNSNLHYLQEYFAKATGFPPWELYFITLRPMQLISQFQSGRYVG